MPVLYSQLFAVLCSLFAVRCSLSHRKKKEKEKIFFLKFQFFFLFVRQFAFRCSLFAVRCSVSDKLRRMISIFSLVLQFAVCCSLFHRCSGGFVLGASESISRPTSIQDRQQTYCNFVEIIDYFMIYHLLHPYFDQFYFLKKKTLLKIDIFFL